MLKTPIRSLQANALCERLLGALRRAYLVDPQQAQSPEHPAARP
jgi:hypothetical protein